MKRWMRVFALAGVMLAAHVVVNTERVVRERMVFRDRPVEKRVAVAWRPVAVLQPRIIRGTE